MTINKIDKDYIHLLETSIASYEKNLCYDVLIAACLLHDIGRAEQFENPKLCHAKIGSEKAYKYLVGIGWNDAISQHVRDCILSHRFRSDSPPKTLEAKILFDADKIDVTGALGVARALFYKGEVSEPLYTVLQNKAISDGSHDTAPSFFQEYKFKLEKLYDNFYTSRAQEIASERQSAAVSFYNNMFNEVNASYENGLSRLSRHVK